MKLLIAGDLHLTDKSPENRIDDYFITQTEKVSFILETGRNNKIDALLLGGDVFDNYKQSNYVLQYYINKFLNLPFSIYTTIGQHDMKYHSSDQEDTALAVLHAAMVICACGTSYISKEVDIYESPFGGKIPEPLDNGKYNILLTHRMIVHNDKIWEEQSEFDYAENLLRQYPKYNLIVSGDNHHYFHAEIKGRHLFNCGSLMRSTTAQLEHKPKIVLFDTDTGKYKEIEIPIKPISEIFDLHKVEKKKEEKKDFDAFISGLSETKAMHLSFQDSLDDYLKKNKVEKSVKSIFEEVLQ